MVRMEGEAVVRVNSEDAQSELKKLQGEASKLRKEIIEASKAEVMDPKKIEALKKKLSETTQEINASKKAAFDYKKVLDNLSGASLTELNKAAQKLNFETKNLARNTEEYAQKSKQLKLLQTEIGKVRKEMSGAGSDTRGFFTRMNDGFNNYGGSIIAFTAGLSGVVLGLRQASEAANAFEERVDNLQAITGLQGENLEYLKQASKDMSISMTEDGIRIKQSADEIVDAFTTMGSQIPALLKNKEALRGVTEDAMILANAGKTELAPAAQGLAMAMNQFNASADQSRRYINALAAGSLEGAGDIPYLSKVFETAGTEAYGLGLNIEQLTAITETIAPKFKEPSVAGTSLRNIFVSLSTGADKFNPKIVGLKTAFDNLADANLSNNDLLKMFGRDSKSAAKILIAQRAETERLTTAVTDTNVAIEQAKINTDNNAAALAQAKNKLHLFTIELGEKMSPALLVSTNLLKYLLQIILHVVNNFDTYKRILIIVTSSILTYTIATKGAALAQAAWSRIVAAGTAIQKLFNSTMKANPLGLFLTALVAVTTTLVLFADKMRGATMSQKVMNDLQTETNKRLAEEKINLDVLFTKLKDVNISTEERAKLIDQINTQYGKYLPSLLTEKSTAEDIDKAYKAINISMRKNIEIQARKEKLIEIEKELIDLNEEARKGTEKLVSDNFLDKLTRQNTLMGMTGVVKDIKELEKVRDELMKSAVDAEIETINTTATESEPENTGSGGGRSAKLVRHACRRRFHH